MTNWKTVTQVARTAKITTAAVSHAVREGLIVSYGEGRKRKIDLEDAQNAFWLKETLGRQDEKDKRKKESMAREKAIKSGGPYIKNKSDYDLEKIKAQTNQINIKIAQDLKILVARELIEKAFGSISGIILNHFFPLGDRLSSVICGELAITDPEKISNVKKIIDKEVMRGLNEFKKECEIDFEAMEFDNEENEKE